MAGKHKHKNVTEDVQPDLPITPMLDMSFQLMAFFLFTFRPAPTEGQIAMSLPKEEGGGDGIPNPVDDKPVTFVVAVEAGPNGTIGNMTIREKDGTGAGDPIGAGVDRYQTELRKRKTSLGGKPSKLTLEIGDGVLHEYVVRLLDVGIGVGFEDIAPVPLDTKKR
jgi:biopolymer transport protein ExbD